MFWLRIFANDENIRIYEVPRPFEVNLSGAWTPENSGGARVKEENYDLGDKESKYKFVVSENPRWPLNPQYLILFDTSVAMKIVLKKTQGLSTYESAKIGLILCKPEQPDSLNYEKKKNLGGASANKKDMIKRVLESTKKLLNNQLINPESIHRKLCFNSREWVVESEYSNEYVASSFVQFNKIDNPVILIPTMERAEDLFNYSLQIYSNKPVQVISLCNQFSKILIDEWEKSNCFGNHLLHTEKKAMNVKEAQIDDQKWMGNPKFRIYFDSREKIPEVEFEVFISRAESIWKDKIAKGIVKTMVGVYLFDYDKENWKNKLIDKESVNFEPKLEIHHVFKKQKVDPRGFIIMPTTYSPGIKGPFNIMVYCKEKFFFEKFEE